MKDKILTVSALLQSILYPVMCGVEQEIDPFEVPNKLIALSQPQSMDPGHNKLLLNLEEDKNNSNKENPNNHEAPSPWEDWEPDWENDENKKAELDLKPASVSDDGELSEELDDEDKTSNQETSTDTGEDKTDDSNTIDESDDVDTSSTSESEEETIAASDDSDTTNSITEPEEETISDWSSGSEEPDFPLIGQGNDAAVTN